jgi:hypothetical protein
LFGKFHATEASHRTLATILKPNTLKSNLIFFITLFLCLSTTFGQQTISGRIIAEDLEIGTPITVYDKDTLEIGKTDINGYFEIELQKDHEKLIFAGIGYEWTKIELPKDCESLELILFYQGSYHYKSNRKVDRIRKRRFDKISELHLKAYNNGLFKTKKSCLNREFEPDKPELDKIGKQLKIIMKENERNFKLIKVGDTITIPFSAANNSDRTEKTNLIVYSYFVTRENFDCKIQGVVTKKQKNRKGHFLTYRVTEIINCEYNSIFYNDKAVEVGKIFEANMKYSKVITN